MLRIHSSRFVFAATLAAVCLCLSVPNCVCAQTIRHFGTITVAPANRNPYISCLTASANGMTVSAVVDLIEPRKTYWITYDVETQQEISRHEMKPGTRWYKVVLSPDGKTLISNSSWISAVNPNHRGPLLEIRDAKTLEARHRLKLAQLEAHELHITPDSKTLVTHGPGHILLIDLDSGKPIRRFASLDGYCGSVLSPDGKRLAVIDRPSRATQGQPTRLCVYDLARGKPSADITLPFFHPRSKARTPFSVFPFFSPDSKIVAIADSSSSIAAYSVEGGKLLWRKDIARAEHSMQIVRFTRDGQGIILAKRTSTKDGAGLDVFSLRTNQLIRAPHVGPAFRPLQGDISQDSSTVALSNQGQIRIYRIYTPKAR